MLIFYIMSIRTDCRISVRKKPIETAIELSIYYFSKLMAVMLGWSSALVSFTECIHVLHLKKKTAKKPLEG